MADDSNCILLVTDDDEDDRVLIADAFAECGFGGEMLTARNGNELLQRLETLPIDDSPLIILLDLNMPVMSGYEVLEELKNHERFRKIPVVVLTTSSAEEDVLRAYQLGGNSFMTKPGSYDGLVDSVRALIGYWCGAATIPAAR